MRYTINYTPHGSYYIHIDKPGNDVRTLLNAMSIWGGYTKTDSGCLSWEMPLSIPVENMCVALHRLGAVKEEEQ